MDLIYLKACFHEQLLILMQYMGNGFAIGRESHYHKAFSWVKKVIIPPQNHVLVK